MKTVNEPAKCFSDAMLQVLNIDMLYGRPNSETEAGRIERKMTPQFKEEWARVSLTLCSFHAILMERSRYESMAFTGSVHFNFNDLKIALTLTKVMHNMKCFFDFFMYY